MLAGAEPRQSHQILSGQNFWVLLLPLPGSTWKRTGTGPVACLRRRERRPRLCWRWRGHPDPLVPLAVQREYMG